MVVLFIRNSLLYFFILITKIYNLFHSLYNTTINTIQIFFFVNSFHSHHVSWGINKGYALLVNDLIKRANESMWLSMICWATSQHTHCQVKQHSALKSSPWTTFGGTVMLNGCLAIKFLTTSNRYEEDIVNEKDYKNIWITEM